MLLLPSVLRSPLEESRRRTSAPAQAAPLPICRGMITTRVNTNDRNSKGGDNNFMHGMNLQFLPDDPPTGLMRLLSQRRGTVSTSSLKSFVWLTVSAARTSKPVSISTKLKLRSKNKRLCRNEKLRIRCVKRRNYWILIYCGISR